MNISQSDNTTMTSYRSAIDHIEHPEMIPLGVIQSSSYRLNCKTAESVYKSKPLLNSAPIHQPSLTTTQWDGTPVSAVAQKQHISPSPSDVNLDGVKTGQVDLRPFAEDPGPTSICVIKPSDVRQMYATKSIMDQFRNEVQRNVEVEDPDYPTVRSVSFDPVEDLHMYEPLTGEHSDNTFFPSPGSGSKVPRRRATDESVDNMWGYVEGKVYVSRSCISPTHTNPFSPMDMLEYGGSIHLADSEWSFLRRSTKPSDSMPRYMRDTISCRNKKRSKADVQSVRHRTFVDRGTRPKMKNASVRDKGKKPKRDLLDFFRR